MEGGPWWGSASTYVPEEGHPPIPFKEALCVPCSNRKLVSLPHAGEIAPSLGTGSESVCNAVRTLGTMRIMHGILADGDEGALWLLRERDIVLDVGVASKLLLKVASSLVDHPLFREALGMDDDLLAKCAKTAFKFSYAPESLKRRGVEGVDRTNKYLISSNAIMNKEAMRQHTVSSLPPAHDNVMDVAVDAEGWGTGAANFAQEGQVPVSPHLPHRAGTSLQRKNHCPSGRDRGSLSRRSYRNIHHPLSDVAASLIGCQAPLGYHGQGPVHS
ncbi:hypothetical protein ACHAWF_006284 [Thalassiosira exigua]